MLYVLYSDDYEVFLGGNYRPEREVLIDTTNALLAACEDIGIPMTLFADVCCLWRYTELGQTAFPQAAETQLCSALRRGHDVQAHVHPHWAVADIQRDATGATRYSYDLSRFLLGYWATEADGDLYQFARVLLERAKTYLTDLLRPVVPGYCCVAFRAGGYGLQPGTAAILAALEDAGYLIDSSVVPGMRLESNVNQIDFTEAPELGNYRLSRQHGLSASAAAGIFEIPIATGVLGRTAKLYSWASRLRKGRRRQSLGCAIQSTDSARPRVSLLRRLLRAPFRWPRTWAVLELCGAPHNMFDITRNYVDKHRAAQTDLYFSFSCHSKSTEQQTLDALKRYHHRLKRHYGSSLAAITFQEAACRLAGAAQDASAD